MRAALFLFVLFYAWAGWAHPRLRPMGLEFEYAVSPSLSALDARDKMRLLLENVRDVFGGSELIYSPWNKYSNAQGTEYVQFTDIEGRVWKVVPEAVGNTGTFDGVELITPPLKSTEDIERLYQVLGRIEQDGVFTPGVGSSTHYTIDISDLVGANDNVARVVDLILFLESHVLEIYNVVNPRRYGKTMNGFAVPLALNQKSLLTKLAELPREARTFRAVQSIFRSHQDRERDIVDYEDVKVWKFRAFNYGKFFALGRFTDRIPVLEIRIADLVDASNFLKLGRFYEALVEAGGNTPQDQFYDPFPQFYSFPDTQRGQMDLNDYIHEGSSAEQIEDFNQEIGFEIHPQPPHSNDGLTSLSCRSLL